MQASTAMKEGKPALNWRQRKKLVAARGEAMASRQQLVDGYVAALGAGARSNPIMMTDIERAADLVMLARDIACKLLQQFGIAKIVAHFGGPSAGGGL
jgi:hypothetical protein